MSLVTTIHAILRFVHILAGTLVLIAGTLAMIVAKGSRVHRLSGNLFFGAMLVLGLIGIALALMKATPNVGNILGGSMAVYMVLTAWTTVIRPPAEAGRSEVALAAVGACGALAALTLALFAMSAPTGRFAGYPAPLYFAFSAVAALATALDVRLIKRGGLTGTPRITRHLWRMSVAFYLATASFFFGQPKFVPAILKQTNLYIVAAVLPLVLMLYWLVRIRVKPISISGER